VFFIYKITVFLIVFYFIVKYILKENKMEIGRIDYFYYNIAYIIQSKSKLRPKIKEKYNIII